MVKMRAVIEKEITLIMHQIVVSSLVYYTVLFLDNFLTRGTNVVSSLLLVNHPLRSCFESSYCCFTCFALMAHIPLIYLLTVIPSEEIIEE